MTEEMIEKEVTESVVPMTPKELASSEMIEAFVYPGDGGEYTVYSFSEEEGPIVRTAHYNLVVAKNPSGQIGLAMIAATEEDNGYVDAQARVLTTLQSNALVVDEEATKIKPFYGAIFPMPLERFDADGRLGLFMGYHEVIKTYKQLVPVCVYLNDVRIDLKSGAWMLGKLLKLLSYVHAQNFTVGVLDSTNIFLELGQHGVFVMDFTEANEAPSPAEKLEEVKAAAKEVWLACGGTDEVSPPHDSVVMTEEQHAMFVEFLQKLMRGEMGALEAHLAAYAMFDVIWPKKSKTDEHGTVVKRDWHELVTYPR